MLSAIKVVGSKSLNLGYVSGYNFVPSTIYNQTFRWKRKPIWLGTAKSKIFRVPKRPVIPLEDKLEIERLHNNYRTLYRSIKIFCQEAVEKNQVTLDHDYLQKCEDDDFLRCEALNNKWNSEIAKQREFRLALQWEKKEIKIHERMKLLDEKERLKQEQADAMIRKAKADRPTFITEANIDQAIEHALQNVVNYDKVLDVDGNFFEMVPESQQTTTAATRTLK